VFLKLIIKLNPVAAERYECLTE